MILKRFQKDQTTLKAHQWKHYFDLYQGCSHDCEYCLYRNGTEFKQSAPLVNVTPEALEQELQDRSAPGITYLGATSDIYQPQEKKRGLVRPILSVFKKLGQPVVLGTKSLLVLRDADILSDLAQQGLAEVSITLITLDEQLTRVLEHGAPTVRARLALARSLSDRKIPVTFHVAPLIPGLFREETLDAFVGALMHSGAIGAYSCVLGLRDAYAEQLLRSIKSVNPELETHLRQIYGPSTATNATPPLTSVVVHEMQRFSNACKAHGFEFYCEHLPCLDTNTREGGVFRYKLPTVGDLCRFFTHKGTTSISRQELLGHVEEFPAVDSEYRSLVSLLWDNGTLFHDTYFVPNRPSSPDAYVRAEQVDVRVTEVMACDDTQPTKEKYP